jgi:signal transduction histidine kinase
MHPPPLTKEQQLTPAYILHIMKRKLSSLARRYASALRKHLKQGPRASLQPARGLGRLAVTLGLETLDVVRIHEDALASLEAASSRDGIIQRAELFFTEAITPIEKTHHAAIRTKSRLRRLSKTLGRRTLDLAVSNRSLKKSIVRRKTVEKALKKSGGNSRKLLGESRRLQKHLRDMAHQILSAQENNRKKISHDLQDEIAQTLLGINVRLLSLRKEAAASAEGLEKDVASTQRLVDKSVLIIKRFAREFGKPHKA